MSTHSLSLFVLSHVHQLSSLFFFFSVKTKGKKQTATSAVRALLPFLSLFVNPHFHTSPIHHQHTGDRINRRPWPCCPRSTSPSPMITRTPTSCHTPASPPTRRVPSLCSLITSLLIFTQLPLSSTSLPATSSHLNLSLIPHQSRPSPATLSVTLPCSPLIATFHFLSLKKPTMTLFLFFVAPFLYLTHCCHHLLSPVPFPPSVVPFHHQLPSPPACNQPSPPPISAPLNRIPFLALCLSSSPSPSSPLQPPSTFSTLPLSLSNPLTALCDCS
ncbi:hypothetical protein AMTRI_Chr04g184210 [Amborella trichopoda]